MSAKNKSSSADSKRMHTLFNLLLKYSVLDFSEKAIISNKGDEIDAFAAGINTLAEKLQIKIKEITLSEETHRQSESNLKFALDASQTGHWDLDLITHTANRSLRHDQIFGYQTLLPEWSYEVFLNKHVHPEDRKFVDETFQRAISRGTEWYFECRIIRVDNLIRWIWARGQIFKDEQGKQIRMLGFMQDFTERKLAEENLLQSLKETDNYKYALDESCIVAITDQRGIINYVNDNFCKISKYQRHELIGQDHRIINSGHHSKEFIKNLWTTIANGKVWRGEIKNKAKDGTYYWVDTTLVPFINEQEKPFQYVAIRAEITERKKQEEEQKKLNEQLAAVNKELESFTYSVSHDLRAPLRAIDGFANIIHEDYSKVLDDEGKRLLEVVQYNAKKMGILIDDLLDFSHLGREEVQKTNVDMKELAEAALMEVSRAIKHKAEVKIGNLYAASADYALMNQVLVNLISNGIKYSSKTKKPLVEIRSEQINGEVIYSVKDNGTGFDMQYAHKLFGVFQRLHKAEEFEGTGVGLAIVQRIITKHGGKVWAEAKLNEGATFYFSLPINKTN
ncbi:MAG: PAS domain-containing protein [Bacteroidota bacterium]|nr:PAS domain-containing protein [Bacteroidota bacterium]